MALSDYNLVVKLNPSFAEAYFNRAVIYFQLKRYDKSWADVYKAEELGVDINPRFLNALTQMSGNNK